MFRDLTLYHLTSSKVGLTRHHANISVYTPLIYSKIGVYNGIHNFLMFALKQKLWVLFRTASLMLRAKIIKYHKFPSDVKIIVFTVMKYFSIITFEPRCEKTGFCNREADQRLCFCYIDSTIPLLPRSEISRFCPSCVVVQPGLCGAWLEPRRPVFLQRGSIIDASS